MMVRDPVEVAGRIRAVVPDVHKGAFDSLIRSFQGQAPEERNLAWAQLSVACNSLLAEGGGFVHTWQIEMMGILTDGGVEL